MRLVALGLACSQIGCTVFYDESHLNGHAEYHNRALPPTPGREVRRDGTIVTLTRDGDAAIVRVIEQPICRSTVVTHSHHETRWTYGTNGMVLLPPALVLLIGGVVLLAAAHGTPQALGGAATAVSVTAAGFYFFAPDRHVTEGVFDSNDGEQWTGPEAPCAGTSPRPVAKQSVILSTPLASQVIVTTGPDGTSRLDVHQLDQIAAFCGSSEVKVTQVTGAPPVGGDPASPDTSPELTGLPTLTIAPARSLSIAGLDAASIGAICACNRSVASSAGAACPAPSPVVSGDSGSYRGGGGSSSPDTPPPEDRGGIAPLNQRLQDKIDCNNKCRADHEDCDDQCPVDPLDEDRANIACTDRCQSAWESCVESCNQ
jgi:hypothetical protein